MAVLRCPGCAAPFEPRRPDPLARCEWCGALLAAASGPDRLAAAPAIDAAGARAAVLARLSREGPAWSPEPPLLVAYPFAADGTARQPLRPLAALPPALASSWRASGTDLETGRHDPFGESAVRVTATSPPPAGTRIVLYPFWRVPLRRADNETAAWCDAVDGQVLLPDELLPAEPDELPAAAESSSGLAPLAGLVLGAALPLPWSLAPLLLALALVARPTAEGTRR